MVFVGAIGAGTSIAQMPSLAKAKEAARNVFAVKESPSLISPDQPGVEGITKGRIEFKGIYFRYPNRKKYVLRKFNLVIEPNQSVAFVGASGSGKSTLASLLLRFYDVSRGKILVDGTDLKEFSLRYFRQNVSIV